MPAINPKKLPPIPSLWPPKGKAPKKIYALETFRFETSVAKIFLEPISSYLAVMKARNWKRLILASEVTGNPKQLVQIWETPNPYPGPFKADPDSTAEEERDALREYREFFEGVAFFERILFSPMPYDPGAKRPILVKNDTLMIVRANVRDGALARLAYLKEKFFLPTVQKDKELLWKMHSAGYVVSTSHPGSTIVQCWKLPKPSALTTAMSKMGQNGTYREFVAPCIVEEKQEFYSLISDDT